MVLVLILSSMQIVFSFKIPFAWPAPLAALYDATAPFEIVNGYGLFAVMTTDRPEIILEGSDDGRVWKAYGYQVQARRPASSPPLVGSLPTPIGLAVVVRGPG